MPRKYRPEMNRRTNIPDARGPVLSWCGAISATPGIMEGVVLANPGDPFSGDWTTQEIVVEAVKRRCVRNENLSGQKTRHGAENAGGADTDTDTRNISFGEEARLDLRSNALKLKTHIAFKKLSETPHSCNDIDVRRRMVVWAHSLISTKTAVNTLAERIVYQILAANIIWRNKVFAGSIGVEAKWRLTGTDKSGTARYTGSEFLADVPVLSKNMKREEPNLQDPYKILEVTNGPSFGNWADLSKVLSDVFSGKYDQSSLLVDITVVAAMSPGQSVYPSQAFQLKLNDYEPKKVFQKFCGKPIISADKITNALRRFDFTHGNTNVFDVSASMVVPVEPAGGTIDGPRVRGFSNEKPDFYAYQKAAMATLAEGKPLPTLPQEETIYLLACFMRGGVFVKRGAPKNSTAQEPDNDHETVEENGD